MAKQYILAGSVKPELHDAMHAYAKANGHTMAYLIARLVLNSGIVEWYAAGGKGRLDSFAKAPLNKIEPDLVRAIADFANRYGRTTDDIANTLLRVAVDEMYRREQKTLPPKKAVR